MAFGTASTPTRGLSVYLICILQLIFITYAAAANGDNKILKNINDIKSYWANLREYEDLPEDNFGVKDTGLPAGCQVEQVQMLHRHAARYPSSVENVYVLVLNAKITGKAANASFSGPLSFLNNWRPQIGSNFLVAAGVSMGYTSGTTSWTRYGRLLYNAAPGQPQYNATNQQPPLVRCNAIPRVKDTAYAWANGFFGEYNADSKYTLLQIPATTTRNSSLAAFSSCLNYATPTSGLAQSLPSLTATVEFYLTAAQKRLAAYAPAGIVFTAEDIYAMQSLCTYEYYALGSSEFCELFTRDEWEGFEYLYDSFMYNSASFGCAAGRALGIGAVQEILARLQHQYITSSSTSVNSTEDSNPATFPLDQKLYFDGTNDFTIVAALTAMSLDYFRTSLPLTYPRLSEKRHFRLKEITPYAGRLITEKIGCISPRPNARSNSVTQYSNTGRGYDASAAQYKFVRMRLNNGILPLKTIRGGLCDISRRTDGLCPLDKFVASQADAEQKANYQFVCFGNYTVDPSKIQDDGTYPTTS